MFPNTPTQSPARPAGGRSSTMPGGTTTPLPTMRTATAPDVRPSTDTRTWNSFESVS